MSKKPKIAISYIRFSTLEQQKGDSFRRQLAKTQAWCQANNYQLDDTLKLRDLGVSAFRGNNAKTGKLKKFIDLLEAGEIKADALVVESLDRLSRDEVGEALRLFLNILSHGLEIVTLKPAQVFTKQSINDPVNLIMAILEICRGFSESDWKSTRVGDAWHEKKSKDARQGTKITSRCPGWLKLNSDRKSFSFVPAKVRSVKRLIELSKQGVGINTITKMLNNENLPTLMDHAMHWHASSVLKVLNARALYGEYQPRFSNRKMSELHRKPDGEPIADYYPALITKDEYLAIQGGLHSRRQIAGFGQGRQSDTVSFLFPKMLVDVETGATIIREDKGKKAIPCLISSRAKAGIEKRLSFPYPDFEAHFLSWLREVKLDDLSNKKQTDQAKTRLKTVKGMIAEKTKRLQTLAQGLIEDPDIDTLMNAVRDLNSQLKTLKQEEQVLLGETAKNDPTSKAQTLLDTLKNANDDQWAELRSQIRLMLSELIETIRIKMWLDEKCKFLDAEIVFRNGQKRSLLMMCYWKYTKIGSDVPRRELISVSGTSETDISKQVEWHVIDSETARFGS